MQVMHMIFYPIASQKIARDEKSAFSVLFMTDIFFGLKKKKKWNLPLSPIHLALTEIVSFSQNMDFTYLV